METTDINLPLVEEPKLLIISPDSYLYLQEISRWTSFFAILGFIFTGLMMLFSVMIIAVLPSFQQESHFGFPLGFLGFIYIIFTVIHFFPVLYLYRFSVRMKKALMSIDSEVMTDAFSSLKTHIRFIGILIILMLIIYIALILGVILLRM